MGGAVGSGEGERMTERLLRLRDVTNKTGLGSSTIYRKMGDPKRPFPRPVALGPQTVRWRESDVDQWIVSLPTSDPRH
jgi:prophage regulatory protein